MAEQFTGIVEILNSDSGAVEITLSGGDDESNPFITIGGGEGGSLWLRDNLNRVRVVSNANTASTRFQTEDGGISVFIDGARGDITAGGTGVDGDIILKGSGGFLQDRIRLDAGSANVWIGGNDRDGDLLIFNRDGDNRTVESATIHLNGDTGNVRTQSLSLSSDGSTGTFLTGGGGSLFIVAPGAQLPTIQFNAQNGFMQVLSLLSQSIQLQSAGGGSIFLGGEDSTMLLGDTLRLEGDNGNIVSRNLQLLNAAGGGSIFLGGENSTILLGNTLRLDGEAGDIILQNADCAEEFDISEKVEPGTVMVLDAEGKLRQSTEAYDKKVAGVISGAGDYKPGIVLDRQSSQNLRMPVALMGKVYCKVDAQYGAIEVGDLLTTSSTPGHAMKASDPMRAFGTVIGKALKPLQKGRDIIPILVTLQ